MELKLKKFNNRKALYALSVIAPDEPIHPQWVDRVGATPPLLTSKEIMIESYGFKWRDEYRHLVMGGVKYGVGLEFEVVFERTDLKAEAGKLVERQANRVLAASYDSTIGYKGIEFTSIVMDKEQVMHKAGIHYQYLKAIVDDLKELKATLNTNCGGHIHYSSPNLVQHETEFCMFIECLIRYASNDFIDIKPLFGRTPALSGYSHFAFSESVDDLIAKDPKERADRIVDRHSLARSCGGNGHIEFRLPAGTLNINKIVSRIKFLNIAEQAFWRVMQKEWKPKLFKGVWRQVARAVQGIDNTLMPVFYNEKERQESATTDNESRGE